MTNDKEKIYNLLQDFLGFFFLTSLVQIKIEFVKRKENPRKIIVILKK